MNKQTILLSSALLALAAYSLGVPGVGIAVCVFLALVLWQGLHYYQNRRTAATGTIRQEKDAGVINPSQYATFSGAELHYIKRGFDELIAEKLQAGLLEEVKLIQDNRSEFIDWVKLNNPEYKTARDDTAAWSSLINRRKIGQQLESVLLASDFGEDGVTLRSDSNPLFVNAIAAVRDKLISHSGLPYGSELEDYMTAEDVKILDGVWRSMAIEVREKELAASAMGQAGDGFLELKAQLEAYEIVVTEAWLFAYEMGHGLVPEGNSERNPGYGPIDFDEWQEWKKKNFDRTGSLWNNHLDGLPSMLRDSATPT